MENDFNPDKLTFGFIGLGLIGGSMAKALRSVYKDCTIIAYNRSKKPREMALADGTADVAADTVDDTFSQCDFIFLCTPVEFNESYLNILSAIKKEGCIISDVGSVKGNIHRAASKAGLDACFIGGHPMAGSEKAGYEHSSKELCSGAAYPITTTEANNPDDIKKYVRLIESIGFKPILMTAGEHDFTAAAISHLPHLAAAELALLARDNEDDSAYMQKLASTGFKDTTRIAASSADIWQQICISNSENIADLLGQYISRLTELKCALDRKDKEYIKRLFEDSKAYRDLF